MRLLQKPVPGKHLSHLHLRVKFYLKLQLSDLVLILFLSFQTPDRIQLHLLNFSAWECLQGCSPGFGPNCSFLLSPEFFSTRFHMLLRLYLSSLCAWLLNLYLYPRCLLCFRANPYASRPLHFIILQRPKIYHDPNWSFSHVLLTDNGTTIYMHECCLIFHSFYLYILLMTKPCPSYQLKIFSIHQLLSIHTAVSSVQPTITSHHQACLWY